MHRKDGVVFGFGCELWILYRTCKPSYVTFVEVGDFTIEAGGDKCTPADNSRLYVGNGEVKTFTFSGCRGRYLELRKSQPTGLSLCRVKVYGTCTGK